jgi:hypothetical protein
MAAYSAGAADTKPPTIGYIGQSTAVAEAQRLAAFVQRAIPIAHQILKGRPQKMRAANSLLRCRLNFLLSDTRTSDPAGTAPMTSYLRPGPLRRLRLSVSVAAETAPADSSKAPTANENAFFCM